MKNVHDIERSIIKSYRKQIWTRFVKAINEYELVEDGDKIAVAISGGKDSLLLAKLFQELQRHGKKQFDLEFIAMNPGYTQAVLDQNAANAKALNIPMVVYDAPVFEVAERMMGDKPCYMCARMRRGSLYNKAQDLGCNKLALGQHMDDVIETVLMNVLFSGIFKTMMPKIHSTNFENMELIRPMVFIREQDVIRWRDYNEIEAIDCACSVTEKTNFGARAYVKNLIAELEAVHPEVIMSLYNCASNIELGATLGFKDFEGNRRSFLEFY